MRITGTRRLGIRFGILRFLTGAIFMGLIAGCGDTSNSVSLSEPDPVGGPPLLRQLTESQYRATIADIFSPEVPVVARFGKALRADGLLAVGTSEAGISAFAIEQYHTAAKGVADAVFSEERRNDFLSCKPESATAFDEQCAATFIDKYGPLLFRRPLDETQRKRYLEAAKLGAAEMGGFYEGMKYALAGMMTSPQFLLRIERTEPNLEQPGLRQLDDFSKAVRLSYFLTNSTPDPALMHAAKAGELDTEEGLARQVDRLIASPRFEQAVRAFFIDMLEFDLFDDLSKDTEIFPAFNSDVAKDAQEQTLRDIVYHLIEQQEDYRDLFTLQKTFMSRNLGVIYRQPVKSRDGWERQDISFEGDRAGIHSQISFVALHSHPGRTSPSLRGQAIRNVFLCQEVPEPPADVDFSAVQDATAEMPTARDRLAVHNSQPACAGCHKVMDPIGLGLENYDGMGAYRRYENSVMIDASGNLDGMAYTEPQGLAKALHDHPETPRCLVEKMYRFAVGRDTVWDERAYMDFLIDVFKAAEYNVPKLMREIALSENFFAITESADAESDSTLANTTVNKRNPS